MKLQGFLPALQLFREPVKRWGIFYLDDITISSNSSYGSSIEYKMKRLLISSKIACSKYALSWYFAVVSRVFSSSPMFIAYIAVFPFTYKAKSIEFIGAFKRNISSSCRSGGNSIRCLLFVSLWGLCVQCHISRNPSTQTCPMLGALQQMGISSAQYFACHLDMIRYVTFPLESEDLFKASHKV